MTGVNSLTHSLSFFQWCGSPLSRFHLALWSICVFAFLKHTSRPGLIEAKCRMCEDFFFFFLKVVLYLIMYWQLLSCCISPAASTASCHRIISQCLWLRPNVKPQGAITVSQFTWGRSQTAFHQHKREKLQDKRDSIMVHFVLTLWYHI